MRCKVCAEPERARLIEADWAGGMSATGVAARMEAAGWPIEASTVLRHLKNHVPGAATRTNVPVLSKRDAATFIKDRILDEYERREAQQEINDELGEPTPDWARVSILDKDLQPALKTALAAQKIQDTRESKRDDRKTAIALGLLLAGGIDGFTAPAGLLGDGMTIDGEAEEVEDDDDAEE